MAVLAVLCVHAAGFACTLPTSHLPCRKEEHAGVAAAWDSERQQLLGTQSQQAEQIAQLKAAAQADAAALSEAACKAEAAEQRAGQLAADLAAAQQAQQQLQGELESSRKAAATQAAQLRESQAACTAEQERAAALFQQLEKEAQGAQALRAAVAAAEAQLRSDRERWEEQATKDRAALEERNAQFVELQGQLQRAQRGAEGLAAALAAANEREQGLQSEQCRLQQAVADLRETLAADGAAAEAQRKAAAELGLQLGAALAQAGRDLQETRQRLESELERARIAHVEEMERKEEEFRWAGWRERAAPYRVIIKHAACRVLEVARQVYIAPCVHVWTFVCVCVCCRACSLKSIGAPLTHPSLLRRAALQGSAVGCRGAPGCQPGAAGAPCGGGAGSRARRSRAGAGRAPCPARPPGALPAGAL